MIRYFSGFLIVLFIQTGTFSIAQNVFPKNLFVNPLDIPISLAGSYGECRPNHFHNGIDIKTNQKENLPIKSAADGEISRIGISHSGYGNVLYIKHNNGFTTVYGHLNKFAPEIQSYVKTQQYRLQSWAIDLQIPEGTLPVKQGQFIAYSGNTGGSTSPHLHFEIRDNETEKVLNASLFGLPIKDTKAPVAKQIAVYDAHQSIYSQNPQILTLNKSGNNQYTASAIHTQSDKIMLGVFADDIMEGSTNVLGIYKMTLLVNGEVYFEIEQDSLDFSNNRFMNAYGDYTRYKKSGKWFQGLYRLKNNFLPVYPIKNNDGIISLIAHQPTKITVQLIDAFGNQSNILLNITSDGKELKDKKCDNDFLQKGVYENEWMKFVFNTAYFYDNKTCFFASKISSKEWSNEISMMNATVPLHSYGELSIKLNKLVPFEYRTKLIFVHQVKAEKLPGAHPQEGIAVDYKNGRAVGMIRTLGAYYVSIDTIAPTINPSFKDNSNLKNVNSISFKVTESQTSIASFNVFIDDTWVLCSRKGNTYTYTFDEHCPSGNHSVKILAIDESKNETVKTLQFVN